MIKNSVKGIEWDEKERGQWTRSRSGDHCSAMAHAYAYTRSGWETSGPTPGHVRLENLKRRSGLGSVGQ